MTKTLEREIIVVGGGISGLTTAWRLKRAGADVALLESEPSVGGCMRTERRDGFMLEKGPFNVLVRDEAFHALLDACAADVEPIKAAEAANARFVLKAGRLMQVPMGPAGLVGTPLLSTRAKLRLLRGMLLSRKAQNGDPTIAEAAERRLGREVADTFISSIVAGVFGGDSRLLSLKACFPKAWRFDQERRSPLAYEMRGASRKKKQAKLNPARSKHKGLISFDGGLQSLVDWLGGQLGDDLLTNSRVESIERDDCGYALRCRRGEEQLHLSCRRLVLATPAAATATLLRSFEPDAANIIETIDSASLVVLNLAYRAAHVAHPMQGYGFLVPRTESSVPVMGVLWADSAFPHHAPTGHRIIRVFMGGPRDPDATSRSDDDLLNIATGAVEGLLGIKGEPALVDVCRWPDAIPQYERGHTEKIDQLLEIIEHRSRLHLVGNYLRGVSINDCVRDGTRLADEILEERGSDLQPSHSITTNGVARTQRSSSEDRSVTSRSHLSPSR